MEKNNTALWKPETNNQNYAERNETKKKIRKTRKIILSLSFSRAHRKLKENDLMINIMDLVVK